MDWNHLSDQRVRVNLRGILSSHQSSTGELEATFPTPFPQPKSILQVIIH